MMFRGMVHGMVQGDGSGNGTHGSRRHSGGGCISYLYIIYMIAAPPRPTVLLGKVIENLRTYDNGASPDKLL